MNHFSFYTPLFLLSISFSLPGIQWHEVIASIKITPRDIKIGGTVGSVASLLGYLVSSTYNHYALERTKFQIDLQKKEKAEHEAKQKELLIQNSHKLFDRITKEYKKEFSLPEMEQPEAYKKTILTCILSKFNDTAQPFSSYFKKMDHDLQELTQQSVAVPEREQERKKQIEQLEQLKATCNLLFGDALKNEQTRTDALARTAQEQQRKKEKEDLEMQRLRRDHQFEEQKKVLELEKLQAKISYYKLHHPALVQEITALKQAIKNQEKHAPSWAYEFTTAIKEVAHKQTLLNNEVTTLKKNIDALNSHVAKKYTMTKALKEEAEKNKKSEHQAPQQPPAYTSYAPVEPPPSFNSETTSYMPTPSAPPL